MENQTVVNLISPLASDFERNNNKKKRVVKIKAGERDWEWENDRQPHEQWFVSQRQKIWTIHTSNTNSNRLISDDIIYPLKSPITYKYTILLFGIPPFLANINFFAKKLNILTMNPHYIKKNLLNIRALQKIVFEW